MSFALLVLAVLILVPLALHLRGGSIVALSVSAAILYAGAWFAITYDNGPLPQDRLKTLFWLLHASLLAIPFVLLIFSSAGMFDGYDGDPAGMPVFAMSSAIVSILCLVALAGFLFTALGALIKWMRA